MFNNDIFLLFSSMIIATLYVIFYIRQLFKDKKKDPTLVFATSASVLSILFVYFIFFGFVSLTLMKKGQDQNDESDTSITDVLSMIMMISPLIVFGMIVAITILIAYSSKKKKSIDGVLWSFIGVSACVMIATIYLGSTVHIRDTKTDNYSIIFGIFLVASFGCVLYTMIINKDDDAEDQPLFGILSIILSSISLFVALYNIYNFSKIDRYGRSGYVFYIFLILLMLLYIASASVSLNRSTNMDVVNINFLGSLTLVPLWFVYNNLLVIQVHENPLNLN